MNFVIKRRILMRKTNRFYIFVITRIHSPSFLITLQCPNRLVWYCIRSKSNYIPNQSKGILRNNRRIELVYMIRGVSYEINEAFNCNINYEREFQWEKGSNLTRKIITKLKSRLFFFNL